MWWQKTNVWGFKLRNIKIQAVVLVQFVITKCHDILWQIWQMQAPLSGYWLAPTFYLTNTSSTNNHRCIAAVHSIEGSGDAWPKMIFRGLGRLVSIIPKPPIVWSFRVPRLYHKFYWIFLLWRSGLYHAKRPSRLTLADRKEWIMKTKVLGQQCRSSCCKKIQICKKETWLNEGNPYHFAFFKHFYKCITSRSTHLNQNYLNNLQSEIWFVTVWEGACNVFFLNVKEMANTQA